MKQLLNVQTYAGPNMVKDYRLDYAQAGPTQYSRLIKLTECAVDGSCLQPTNFNWPDVVADLAIPPASPAIPFLLAVICHTVTLTST